MTWIGFFVLGVFLLSVLLDSALGEQFAREVTRKDEPGKDSLPRGTVFWMMGLTGLLTALVLQPMVWWVVARVYPIRHV
jgi:hypothetical protein